MVDIKLFITEGQKFGRLTIIKETFRYSGNQRIRRVICRCDCGKIKTINLSSLFRSVTPTKSCGCLKNEMARATGLKGNNNRKHNQASNGNVTRLYRIWTCMKNRIFNPDYEYFEYYGGRGITICEEWMSSSNFIKWAKENGYNDKLEIDRINNNGNYEPSNCRWVTHTINCQNRRKKSPNKVKRLI